MFLSIFAVGLLSISSFFSFQQDSKDLSREEKCLKYTKIVEESDYTKYDTVYFDYENGPTFLDTELDNITENEYKNRPDFSYHNEIKRENSTRDSSGLYPDSIRYLVSQSDCSTWPYVAVCRIKSKYIDGNGVAWYGDATGALVGPNVFLTASHCVYDDVLGWPVEFNVYPAYYYGENLSIGHASMVAAYVGVVFNTHLANDDWAIVRLDWNIGNVTGYFSVVNESLSINQMARNIAHQSDLGRLTDAEGPIVYVDTYIFYHRISAVTWASGSPIFKQNTLNVCGIHSAGIHENGIDVNTACRVSSYIESWVAGNIIDWAIDD